MNSLDEIIESISFCCEGLCEYCVFEEEHKMRNPCTIALMSDAQTYLKEYREMKQHLACMDKGESRGDDTQIVNNPPLTWDELRKMQGEPVWVDHKHYSKWLIVYEVYENTIVLDGNGFYTQYFPDDNDKEVRGKAYRKERK